MNLKRLLVLPQHVGVLAEQPDVLQQQVAEIGGVEDLQPLLIAVRRACRPCRCRTTAASPAGTCEGVSPRFFQLSISPASIRAGQRLSSMFSACSSCFKQPHLVVDVEHGEVGLELHQLGMDAQDAAADRVEGAEPRHAFDRLAEHLAEAQLHLARGLVGEGHRQDFLRARAALAQDMGDARGQHPRSCRCRRRPAPAPDRRASRPPRAAPD